MPANCRIAPAAPGRQRKTPTKKRRARAAPTAAGGERSDYFSDLRNSRRIHDDSNSKSWRSDSLVLMGSADIR